MATAATPRSVTPFECALGLVPIPAPPHVRVSNFKPVFVGNNDTLPSPCAPVLVRSGSAHHFTGMAQCDCQLKERRVRGLLQFHIRPSEGHFAPTAPAGRVRVQLCRSRAVGVARQCCFRRAAWPSAKCAADTNNRGNFIRDVSAFMTSPSTWSRYRIPTQPP